MVFRFDFGTGPLAPGWTRAGPDSLRPGGGAFSFRLPDDLPDGNYRVTICLGETGGESSTTVFSQSRRLMLGEVRTGRGETTERVIAVNVRTPRLQPPPPTAPGGYRVVLKEEEKTGRDWDGSLCLGFSGPRPRIRMIEIESADDLPTLYLAGDSTVADQESPPYASWGQMLPAFFGPGIVVANHAESGETLKSFISSLRLAKVLERMKPGDYLAMQFGHNDQKAEWPQTWVCADTTYRSYLAVYIAEARQRGATPILVTSFERCRFGPDGRVVPSLGRYPDAVRSLAAETGVALVDLEMMSREFYESMGPERAQMAFAMSGDFTHHSEFGAMRLAACVASALQASGLPLALHLRDENCLSPCANEESPSP